MKRENTGKEIQSGNTETRPAKTPVQVFRPYQTRPFKTIGLFVNVVV